MTREERGSLKKEVGNAQSPFVGDKKDLGSGEICECIKTT